MADSANEFPTTLGADAVFKGQLQFEKGVKLLGKFEGEITSEGQLLVAEGATLTGDVKAGSVRVDGQIKGNLNAKTKVQLSASARLEGDVQTQRLEVAEGAVLVGRCVVGVNGQQSKPTTDVRSVSRPAEMIPAAKGRMPEPAPAMVKK
jgi:cytoskeletal protein CcmA (bactofilin family)